jgi:hypothetical protein
MSGLHTVVGITYIEYLQFSNLELFFGWLLSRRVEGGTQLFLARAWKFGARYSIAPFQNEVMRCLVDILHSNPVDPCAAREACYDLSNYPRRTNNDGEKLKVLRQAFAVQIAY